MPIKNLLNLANTVQAIKLVEHNANALKKKKNTKGIVKLGVENIVGVSLIKLNQDFINS